MLTIPSGESYSYQIDVPADQMGGMNWYGICRNSMFKKIIPYAHAKSVFFVFILFFCFQVPPTQTRFPFFSNGTWSIRIRHCKG